MPAGQAVSQSSALRFLTSERTNGTCSLRSNWARTCSGFWPTRSAIEAAGKSRSYRIVLIDGARLADLMIEHDLGVAVEHHNVQECRVPGAATWALTAEQVERLGARFAGFVVRRG